MSNTSNYLLSHQEKITSLKSSLEALAEKIKLKGDLPYTTVQEQLQILKELSQFELGQFLIQHKGVNGYWTEYFLTFPWRPVRQKESLSKLELFLLSASPIILATQERFQVFLNENQKSVQEGAQLASIPCGLLGEFLYLDYSNIRDITLLGIDLDASALEHAKELAAKKKLTSFVSLQQKDAWALHNNNQFDLISSNGLTIYEPDDAKVVKLYKIFYDALKSTGRLVTSFMTPPPDTAKDCEWIMSEINQDALRKQKIIFSDILDVKFQCFRTSQQTRMQLEEAGFKKIEFIYDAAHLFPTVIASK